MNILTQPDDKPDQPQFERYGSLRRRRQERKENRNLLDVFQRERAPSPNVETSKPLNETKRAVTPSAEKSVVNEFDMSDTPFRRTKSMYDRSTRNSAKASSESKDSEIVDRLRRKLGKRDSSVSPTPETPANLSLNTTKEDNTEDHRARWRSGITPVEGNRNLPIIDEKARLETPTKELEKASQQEVTQESENAVERTRSQMARRLSKRNTMDPSEIKHLLEIAEKNNKNEGTPQTADDQKVSVSVKTQLNRRWMSDLDRKDIDQVLKAIEDSETKKETIDNKTATNETALERQVSSTSKQEESNTGGESEALKAKRKIRKQRSNLSLEDVKQALHSTKITEVNNIKNSQTQEHTNTNRDSTPPPELPPRRSKQNEVSEENKVEHEKKPKRESSNLSKAAKMAANRKFRSKRFGDKDRSSAAVGKVMYKRIALTKP